MFSISEMLVFVPRTPFFSVPDCILSYTVGSKVLSAWKNEMIVFVFGQVEPCVVLFTEQKKKT